MYSGLLFKLEFLLSLIKFSLIKFRKLLFRPLSLLNYEVNDELNHLSFSFYKFTKT